MPWSTCYAHDGVECRFTGATNSEDLYAANDEILRHHRYPAPLRYVIADFTQTESIDLLTADLLDLAESDRQYLLRNPPYVLAMIAPQGLVFGHLRTFERFMEGSALKSIVVQNREQALGWLRNEGVPV